MSVRDTPELLYQNEYVFHRSFGQLIAVTKFGRRSPLTGPQILEHKICVILSRCVRGPSGKRCKIVTIVDHTKIVCPLALAVVSYSSVLLRDIGLCQPQLTSTSRRLKQCVLPQPRRHKSLQLCNFCEVSIEEMRQVLTRSVRLSRVPLSTRYQRSPNVSWSTSHQRSVTHQVSARLRSTDRPVQ